MIAILDFLSVFIYLCLQPRRKWHGDSTHGNKNPKLEPTLFAFLHKKSSNFGDSTLQKDIFTISYNSVTLQIAYIQHKKIYSLP